MRLVAQPRPEKRQLSVETFDDVPMSVFEALQASIAETGMAVLHPGRGNKGLVLIDLTRALYLLDIAKSV